MRVGFDVGGTFTDIVTVDVTGVRATKVLSLHHQIASDLSTFEHETAGSSVAAFVHGTTVASNAIIEGTTARTALITTRGFRDVLELRDQRRPNVYDPEWERLPPFIPRDLRFEVSERILSDGTVAQALTEAEARRVVTEALGSNVKCIAICLLNSYVDPRHEILLQNAVQAEAGQSVTCCASFEIDQTLGEHERTSTTAINASLVPVLASYLDLLRGDLAGMNAPLHVMQSNGGIMTADAVRARPVSVIESGPAAGVLAAARLATEAGEPNVISFDMGGTTAKTCLVVGGTALEKSRCEVGPGATVATRVEAGGGLGAGYAVRMPSIDLVEVGAGGGSIAWVDRGGGLRVGPRSAGAQPGPACYQRGGTSPTVTDANVVLGYISTRAIQGAELDLDPDAAARAITAEVADPLGMSLLDAALGIVRIANATMVRALRAVSTERGHDPRTQTLIAFGGGGPLHCCELADRVGITRILVPPHAGVFSALGLLLADFRQDAAKSVRRPLRTVSTAELLALFEAVDAHARGELRHFGVADEDIDTQWRADMGYAGQLSEIGVVVSTDGDRSNLIETLHEGFVQRYAHEFGYLRDDRVDLLTLRVQARSAFSELSFGELAAAGVRPPTPNVSVRSRVTYFGGDRPVECPVVERAWVKTIVDGPLIIAEDDTSVAVPPGWRVEPHPTGSLLLTRSAT